MFRPPNFYTDHYNAYIQFAVKNSSYFHVCLHCDLSGVESRGTIMFWLSKGQEYWLCSEGAQKTEYSTTDESGYCKTLILHMVKINVVSGHFMLSLPSNAAPDGLFTGKPITFTIHWQLRNLKSGDSNTVLSSEILEICFGYIFDEDVSIPIPFTNRLIL